MKEAEAKNALFLSLPPCHSPLHLDLFNKSQPPRVGEDDIMDFTLIINYHLFSLLTLSLLPNQMASPSRNQ